MTYWKSPEFKALQQAWYGRLKDEGFRDAEEMVDDDMELRRSAANPPVHRPKELVGVQIEAIANYYRLLANCVRKEKWQSDVDRFVLTMHAAGTRIKDIVRGLSDRDTPRCRYSVRIIIRRYEQRWGLREYTPKQLNQRVS